MPKSAHDHAVAEARMKGFVFIEDPNGLLEYFRLVNQRIMPLTTDDRAFLIAEGAIDSTADLDKRYRQGR